MKSRFCLLFVAFVVVSHAFCEHNRYVASPSMKKNYFLIHYNRLQPPNSSLNAVQGELFAEIASKLRKDYNSTNPSSNPTPQRVPYVIQKIGRGNKKEIKELSRLCVDVFFNDQTSASPEDIRPTQRVTPWKAVQLAYLRNAQAGDILTRNAFKKNERVDIIIARQVHNSWVYNIDTKNARYVQDGEQVYNREELSTSYDPATLVLGDIIGYCEVIEKNFGLGEKLSSGKTVPYLANLSVSKYTRKSGVGSKLLDASEEVVREWKAGYKTMVLQVEQDNTDAIQFYKKRGWKFVYADPTCRRFDTSGFFLKESRVTKYAMVREIGDKHGSNDNSISYDIASSSTTQRIKKMWFASQK